MFDLSGKTLLEAAAALLEGETNYIANMANLSALIMLNVDRINWAGFYILYDNELVLGPFQGKPACVRIALGKGVCGTAALSKQTMLVEDVDAFPGHIACDAASRSELVVPVMKDGRVFGVLDMDSAETARFGENEKQLLEAVVRLLEKTL